MSDCTRTNYELSVVVRAALKVGVPQSQLTPSEILERASEARAGSLTNSSLASVTRTPAMLRIERRFIKKVLDEADREQEENLTAQRRLEELSRYNAANSKGDPTMGEFWETGQAFAGQGVDVNTLPKVVVLVDGDIVAYRASAAADGRYYEVDGKRFKYAADAKSHADKKSIPKSSIVNGHEPEPVENAINTVNITIDEIKNYFIYTRQEMPIIKICLSCPRNFRYDLYPQYKASRKNQRKPEHLNACKQHLVDKRGGLMFDPYEADDLIAMAVHEIPAEQQIYIASNDKDFTQLGRPNVKFYDFTAGKVWEVTEDEALLYFYKQILTGDKSDDIPGLPGVGPETAIKILTEERENIDSKPISREANLYLRTLLAYAQHHGNGAKDAREKIELAATLLKLSESEDVGKWKRPEIHPDRDTVAEIMKEVIGVPQVHITD